MYLQQITVHLDKILMQVLMIIINGFFISITKLQVVNPNSNPSSNSITGCSQISYSGAIGGVNGNIGSTSDFYLVELNSAPPQNWGLYFAGWDRSTSASSSGVSIHHPSGDIKKYLHILQV